MRASERDVHDERASGADGTLHSHMAAVQFDQLVHERKANSRSFVGSGLRSFNAMKAELLERLALANGPFE